MEICGSVSHKSFRAWTLNQRVLTTPSSPFLISAIIKKLFVFIFFERSKKALSAIQRQTKDFCSRFLFIPPLTRQLYFLTLCRGADPQFSKLCAAVLLLSMSGTPSRIWTMPLCWCVSGHKAVLSILKMLAHISLTLLQMNCVCLVVLSGWLS